MNQTNFSPASAGFENSPVNKCSAEPSNTLTGELDGKATGEAKVPAGGVVLDPYMGSGTTGIACLRTGRRFVGIEKDPTHYATALERIQRELSQLTLFQ